MLSKYWSISCAVDKALTALMQSCVDAATHVIFLLPDFGKTIIVVQRYLGLNLLAFNLLFTHLMGHGGFGLFRIRGYPYYDDLEFI